MDMAIATALLLLLVATPAAFGVTQHVVGGNSGWNQGVDYSTWAAGQTFGIGDTLLFNYGGSHSVDVVSQSDYSSCNTNNPINSYSGGNTIITLNSAGPMNFICPAIGHCQSGMKLSITVGAASTAPNGSPTTNTTSSPPPPPPPPRSSAALAGNLGGFSLFVVALIAFTG